MKQEEALYTLEGLEVDVVVQSHGIVDTVLQTESFYVVPYIPMVRILPCTMNVSVIGDLFTHVVGY